MKTLAPPSTAAARSVNNQPFFAKSGGSASFWGDKSQESSFFSQPVIQPKLRIGAANDHFEQQADAVANEVVAKLNSPKSPNPQTPASPATAAPPVQTKCADCEQEEKVQKKEDETERGEEKLQRKPIFESAGDPPDDSVQRKCAECGEEEQVRKKGTDSGESAGSDIAGRLGASKGGGAPLADGVRTSMESAMGADFSGVRIHTGKDASQLSQDLSAHAFTHGKDIYFNEGQYSPSTSDGQRLLAHELTHTVQQGASVRRKPAATPYAPPMARSVGRDFAEPVHSVPGYESTPDVQREGWGSRIWNATGGQLVDAAGAVIEFGEKLFWEVVESLGSPALVSTLRQIQREGVLNFFKNKLLQAVNGIFDGLQNNSGAISTIFPQFGQLVARARVIVNALAQGDCKPLFAALNDLKEVVSRLAGEAWDAIVAFFKPATDFLTNMWNSFAMPAIEWLKAKAAHIWNWIKQIGQNIWNWFKPVRDAVGKAWDWLKGIIGLNADETGEEGLIQWVQRKAQEVWAEIQEKLRPIIEPARQMVAKIRAIIPLNAILNLRKTIQDWLKKVVATSTAMGGDASNIQNEATQTSLRDQILPAIQQSIENFRGSIVDAGAWVNGKIGEVFSAVGQFFSNVRSISWLNVAVGAIDWVETKANEVNEWIQSKVTGLFDMVSQGLHHFGQFLKPIYDALKKIFSALGDLLGKLPDFLMGPLWMMLPTCIKEPIKKFFIEQILSRMPFFQKLQKLENIWEKLEAAAITILKQIFIDGALGKAIWTFFSTMLDILGVPPQLVTRVIAKGAQSLSDILEDPLGFLGNFLSALKVGFEQFFGNIWTHLISGMQAWLLSQLEGTDIEMPTEFSFKSMLKLAFQVLGITVEMIAEQAQKVFPEKRGLKQKILKWASRFAKAWDFFERILTDDGSGGTVWDRLEKEIGNLWDMILDGVASWLEGTIVKKAIAWVATKLDPTGVMAVITTIMDVFNIMQAIGEKAREILEMVERILDGIGDLIKGIVKAAADLFERALAAGIPVVLALLSSLFGLDGVVDQIKETIKNIRTKVEQGIEKILRTLRAFVDRMLGNNDKDETDTLNAALAEIDSEGEKEADEGEVNADEAQAIKNKVNQDHPSVIEITSVTDGGETWDFEYVQREKKKIKKRPEKGLVDAVKSAGGVLQFIKAIAHGQVVNGIDRVKLEELMREQENKDFIKGKFREVNRGQHELIPTNLIVDVIDRISGLDTSIEAAEWLDIQSSLRVPTNFILFKPELASIVSGKKSLQGHVGAFKLAGVNQTKWQQEFHDASREAFQLNRGLDQCLEDLKETIKQWIWNGSLTNLSAQDIHPSLTLRGTNVRQNLAQLASEQSSNFQTIMRKIDSVKVSVY